MSLKTLNQKEIDNFINISPPPVQEVQINENIGYNCTECSSIIEIISINGDNLEFKCINNENHNKKLKINNYLEKMKKYMNKKNLNSKCEKHKKEYIFYCLDCKSHICIECIKSKIHIEHKKNYIEEEQPNEGDLNIIKDKMQYYRDNIKNIKENKIKELKKELNNNKIRKNKRIKEIIKKNKIKKLKELKLNKDKYMNDINEFKRKYEEIKLRKLEYETENNNINNKYKLMYDKEIVMNRSKIKELNIIYNKNKENIKNNKKMDNILSIVKLIEIIVNTYNLCNNNYFYCININNIINKYKNTNIFFENGTCYDIINKENYKYKDCKNINVELEKFNIIEEYNNYILAEINIRDKDVNKNKNNKFI